MRKERGLLGDLAIAGIAAGLVRFDLWLEQKNKERRWELTKLTGTRAPVPEPPPMHCKVCDREMPSPLRPYHREEEVPPFNAAVCEDCQQLLVDILIAARYFGWRGPTGD